MYRINYPNCALGGLCLYGLQRNVDTSLDQLADI